MVTFLDFGIIVQIAWFKNGGSYPPSWTEYVISNGVIELSYIFVADINGDGRVDVILGCNNGVKWYMNGAGAPPSWTLYTVANNQPNVLRVYAVDLNADGRMDILAGNNGDGKVMWYKNEGGLTPTLTPYQIGTAPGTRGVWAADVDGDGLMDALSGNANNPEHIAWYKNGGGSTPTWTPYFITQHPDGASIVAAADFGG